MSERSGGVQCTCQRCGVEWFRPGSGRRPKHCAGCVHARKLRACMACGAQWSWLGKAGAGPRYCSLTCFPDCAVDGCAKLMKYRTPLGRLCPAHYVRWKTTGSPGDAAMERDFSAPPSTCRRCDGPRGHGYDKWFCSARCSGRYYRNVDESREWFCVQCGATMRFGSNRKDATRCKRCSNVKPFLSARQLAERDGVACGICREPVDMALSGSRDPSGPAADHVIPRATGGSNSADNLQLAHFHCNAVKRDKILTPAEVEVLAAEARARQGRPDRLPLAVTCSSGHPRTSEYGRWERTGWVCRPCKSARQRKRRHKARAL